MNAIRHPQQTLPLAANEAGLPLLLVAGTACDRRVFEPLLARLNYPSAHVVEVKGAETTPDAARSILAEAPPRFALLGFSLGGIVALEMIAQQPRRIERLCLADTNARPDPTANAVTRRQAVAKARAAGLDGYILDAWPRLVAPANVGNRALRDIICAMARDAGPDRLASQSEIAIHRADSLPRLRAIDVPTLVLAGEHEQVCPLEAHCEMADGIPNASYHIIEDAGHFAPLENPDAVAGHVAKWLGITAPNLHRASRISEDLS